ncbi:hypothetical protein GCM10010174_25720 [Kutzneria viridogrisea]|uniref:Aldo/keto reductase family protein n=1 Tax=Kutzneria viridogrisea TaxID=47990 RepID=A0ABR6BSA9_9PSEU|nr:hypothetical protein [Kutzneria viridogrisea]
MKHRGPSAHLAPAVHAQRALARAGRRRAGTAPASPPNTVSIGSWQLGEDEDGALIAVHQATGQATVLAPAPGGTR